MGKFALAIHGGAGAIQKNEGGEEREQAYKQGLSDALQLGWEVLENSGTALDAVETAVCALEDNPLFNAGCGAVFTHDERHEMDASIMCGRTLEAGAVAQVQHVKNPILLARMILEKSNHVFLGGFGAEDFAREMKLDFESDQYFFDQYRYDQYKLARERGDIQLDHSGAPKDTVGAVALDASGNLASATSTGGMTNKRYGRIGDSPIIGSGTYADNNTAAISCTGHGEYFIRSVTAYDLCALIEYKQMSLEKAADTVLEKLKKRGGDGGLIAINTAGEIVMPYNTAGMYRASMNADGEMQVAIFEE